MYLTTANTTTFLKKKRPSFAFSLRELLLYRRLPWYRLYTFMDCSNDGVVSPKIRRKGQRKQVLRCCLHDLLLLGHRAIARCSAELQYLCM
jgi:hypothetical protein